MNQKYMIYMYLLKARTFIALLLVIAFFSVMVPNFLTASNLLIMTQHVAITGLLAIGMTLVILTGGIDLSVGAVAGICGMVAGALLTNGLPLWNGDILFFNVPEVILPESQRHGSAGQHRFRHPRIRHPARRLSSDLADDRLPRAGLLADH